MSIRLLRFGLPLLFLAPVACDRAEVTATTAPTAVASTLASSSVSFEPSPLRAEFLPGRSCGGRPLFGTRIIIVIRGGLFPRGVRFRFADVLGTTALPRVTSLPGAMPLTAPISTFPTDPIPIPGIAPMPMTHSIPIGTPQTLPFFLAFDCGVSPRGMLTVFLDNVEDNGRMRTSEFHVRMDN